MSTATAFRIVRPLPRSVPPFPGETEKSYLHRLSRINQVPVPRLLDPSHWLGSGWDELDRLSLVSGQPRDRLIAAMPEARRRANESLHPYAPEGGRGFKPRQACRRCVAARTGNRDLPVTAWMSAAHHVCLRHQLWLTIHTEPARYQFDVSGLPEIARAQRRHYRLMRRRGPVTVAGCYTYGGKLWRYLSGRHYHVSGRNRRLEHLQLADDYHERLLALQAADYPEVVEIISIFSSPHLRRFALSRDSRDLDEFRCEFQRRLPQEESRTPLDLSRLNRQLKSLAEQIEICARHDVKEER
ncbi:TniQ family protein [Streptomyces sp. CC219B]|uniref:TniQ family protein n=1 Tax=Streptomyces sp. CC219B TaxID=3044574 RepID=UPI0024A8083E|nr:TniQ family protein [Streptomyces sp. CC219B]